MQKSLLALLALATCLGCGSQQTSSMPDTTATQATAPESDAPRDEWLPLFDGKTTKGWHSYGKPVAGKAWMVDDGALHLDASNKKDWQTNDGGDLVTDDIFGNFHLKLEWKIAPNGNSGIIFYVQEAPATYQQTWNTGLEMQVLDNNGHPDAKIHKHRAGDLYDLIASSPENVRPPGEWNQVEIISDNGRLVFHQNGEKVLSTTLWDEDWRKLVADSKFGSMPGWGTFTSGRIALQDHGDNVWFRNIMIKKL